MDNNQFGYQFNNTPYDPGIPPQPPEDRSKGYAIASLSLGIASICAIFLCCCFGIFIGITIVSGILAIVFAFVAKREANGKMPNMAIAGVVLGIVGIVICIVFVIIIFIVEVMGSEFIEELYRDFGYEFNSGTGTYE